MLNFIHAADWDRAYWDDLKYTPPDPDGAERVLMAFLFKLLTCEAKADRQGRGDGEWLYTLEVRHPGRTDPTTI